MIKVENIEVWGFEHAIRGMRNPMNSWDKSDSRYANKLDSQTIQDMKEGMFILGENDLDLMRRLYKAGPEHRKYLRQIFVSMDITAPLYWISELDTYKVGTARNSCSFMHKGVSKPFEITDFSIHNEKVYKILTPIERKRYELKYPYETDEYKTYVGMNGREYKIFRNGRIVAGHFEYTDTMGRHRVFEEKECKPTETSCGYYQLNIGGRGGEKWMLHRLIASVWLENSDNLNTVNHIDGDKGNNSVENLEWCDLSENIKKGFEAGLYENVKSDRTNYIKWKNKSCLVKPVDRLQMQFDFQQKRKNMRELADQYGITIQQVNNIIWCGRKGHDELFTLCHVWESVINELNRLREEYLETKDNDTFQMIRCLLPCGYNQRFTITMSYENVVNIINQRSGHKLDEWNLFVEELKRLPYIKEIMDE